MTSCPTCEAENADGARFCVKCGTTIPLAASTPESWRVSGDLGQQQQQTGYQPGAYAPPPPSYGAPPSYAPPAVPGYGAPAMTGVGGMPYAAWGDRVLAAIIDSLLVFGVMIVLYIAIMIIGGILGGIGMAIGGAFGGEEGASSGSILGSGFCCIAFVLLPLVSLGIGLYNKVHLVSQRGFSIGQGIMKLKVVTGQGTLVPVGTLVLRLLVQVGFGFVPFLPLVSILWPLWDPQRQALHDKAVGTFVVKSE